MPTLNARPENFLIDDYDYRVTEDEDIRITEDDIPRVDENVANNRLGPDEVLPSDLPVTYGGINVTFNGQPVTYYG